MTREKQIELMRDAPARLDAVFARYKRAIKENDPGFIAKEGNGG